MGWYNMCNVMSIVQPETKIICVINYQKYIKFHVRKYYVVIDTNVNY